MEHNFRCPVTKAALVWEPNSQAPETLAKPGRGSKAGFVEWVHAKVPELTNKLPEQTEFLEPDADVTKFLDQLNFDKPKVIRACHARDFDGLVDVIPSQANVRGRENVEKAIRDILEKSNSDEVKNYFEREHGVDFDGKVGILVQDYCGSLRGSIVEQPGDPGIYRVTVNYAESILGKRKDQFFDKEGRQLHYNFKGDYSSIDSTEDSVLSEDAYRRNILDFGIEAKDKIPEIIRLYQQIKESGIVPESHSFQLEFGFNRESCDLDPKLYQVRMFRPFYQAADFMPVGTFNTELYGTGYGVTPEEGLELPLIEVDRHVKLADLIQADGDHAYLYTAPVNCDTLPLDMELKRPGAYIVTDRQSGVLDHGHYRQLQTFPVVSLGVLSQRDEHLTSGDQGQRVRVVSNGRQSNVEFVD